MKRIPSSPPIILPLPHVDIRPLWSVMIPVYNCGRYLQETLESVLSQELPEETMQIEVVDDASTDIDVAELVNRIGKGRIKYFRQSENVGSLRNFETCINRSRGKLVHLLHGDDKVGKGYFKNIEQLFDIYPEAGAAFCRFSFINESGGKLSDMPPEMPTPGILQNWLLSIGERQLIQYVAITVRREVYEKLGAFYGLEYGEDWEMWVRIARNYPVVYTPEILAYYRIHSNSITGGKVLRGEHLRDLHSAINLIQNYLPIGLRKRIGKRSKRNCAAYGLKIAKELWHKFHNRQIVYSQINEALQLSKHPHVYLMILQLQIKLIVYSVWNRE